MLLSVSSRVGNPLLIALVSLTSSTAFAQPNPIPAPLPGPQVPSLTRVTPLGAQRGSEVTLLLSGTNLHEPIGLWTSFPATATISETDPGNVSQTEVRLVIPGDAPLGVQTLRIATSRGISGALLFCIDELPEYPESANNHSFVSAQTVSVPGVVTGRIDAETSDWLRFSVAEGERIAFDVLASRIGSSLDPVVFLYDATTGREVPGVYSDDELGLSGDARLTHTFEQAGEYALQIRDALHRGGDGFSYRLRMGDFPNAITTLPLAAQRGETTAISFAGVDVNGVDPVMISPPDKPAVRAVQMAPRRADGLAGWPVELLLSNEPQGLEVEPNDTPDKATALSVAGGVSGVFATKGDVDCYSFEAKANQQYVIAARTHEVRSPAEVYLVVQDAGGKVLGRSKPEEAARVEFKAEADGVVIVQAEHLNFAHGPTEVYQLIAELVGPRFDFDVVLGLDRVNVAPGETALLPITAAQTSGQSGSMELTVEGPEGVSGSVVIPAGRMAQNPQMTPILALLPITVAPDTAVSFGELRVRAVMQAQSEETVRYARSGSLASQLLPGLRVPLRELDTHLAISVTEPLPFTVESLASDVKLIPGMEAKLRLRASRVEGFAGEVVLQAVGLPPNVTAAVGPIAPEATEIEITLTADAKAVAGQYPITFRASAPVAEQEFATYATPVLLEIGAAGP